MRRRLARLPAQVALGCIRLYQVGISPWLGRHCRFLPTCSEYSRLAIERYGLVRGLGLALRRIIRCHPFGPGGYDPVP